MHEQQQPVRRFGGSAEEASITRRTFWRRSLGAAGVIAVTGGLGGALAACGGESSSGGSGGGGGGDGEIKPPRIAASTSVIPIFVQQAAGPLLYGREFGLEIPESNYQVLQSHAVAIQTVLSRDADVIAGSVFGSIAGAGQGLPLRLFATARTRDDDVLAATPDVASLDAIFAPGCRVCADSKGGTAYAELQAMIDAGGKEGTKVEDLPSFTVLESSGQRQAALAAGQVNAAIMHVDQFWQVQREKPGVKILARSVDVPSFPLTGYAALRPWLEQNQATATALAKSVAACTQAFADDFEEYRSAVRALIEEPPSEGDLRRLWEFAVEEKIWPVSPAVTEDDYDRLTSLALSADVMREAPPYDEAIDDRPASAA